MTEASNVIPFPRQLRVVPASAVEGAPVPADPRQVVDHDGAVYPLEDLLRPLTPEQLRIVEAAMPRSGQETWDEVVRNWPALADEIAAGVPGIS